MLDGFERREIATAAARINLVQGGSGPPLLLLHGYPQTHVMWHKIAPALAQTHTVVIPDLRGYGDSEKPASDPRHAAYSKRAMARDQVEAMSALGFERFIVVGHDRGARVGHRMALDHPQRVERFAALDIVPTHRVFALTDQAMATAYYHWFFLIQPYDHPERMIGYDPGWYLRSRLEAWSRVRPLSAVFDEAAVAEYVRCFSDPACIHATCEDYRAGASIDLEHDEAEFGHRGITCPVLVLWGGEGMVGRRYDVPGLWRDYAQEVSGFSLACGHFLPEEAPEETLRRLRAFLPA